MKRFLLAAFILSGAAFAQSPCAVSQQYPGSYICNVDGSTGVTANHYVKWNAAATGVVLGGTTDTSNLVIGIANATQTGGGGVLITRYGPALVTFDGATTAGHYCGVSSGTAGDFTDAGSTAPSGTTLCVIMQTIGGTGNAWVDLRPGASSSASSTIASGATAMPITALAANSCDAAATTGTATGALTSDAAEVTYASDPTGVTGYGGGTAGGITIRAWITANTINFKRCNESGGSITPGALSVNWRIVR